jgi:hypothetical protein
MPDRFIIFQEVSHFQKEILVQQRQALGQIFMHRAFRAINLFRDAPNRAFIAQEYLRGFEHP